MADSLSHRLSGQVQKISSRRRGCPDNPRDCRRHRGEIRERMRQWEWTRIISTFSAERIQNSLRAASSRYSKALPHVRYSQENLQSRNTYGVGSSGQTDTTSRPLVKGPIGERSKDTLRNKGHQNKTSNSYRFLIFNTL